MEINGIKRQDVYFTLKKNFSERGMKCVSENDVLVFEDMGRENDYGNMWSIIIGLIKSDWFVKCASSCVFTEDDVEEDILSQVPRLRHIMATA
jgi:hypothetical protein